MKQRRQRHLLRRCRQRNTSRRFLLPHPKSRWLWPSQNRSQRLHPVGRRKSRTRRRPLRGRSPRQEADDRLRRCMRPHDRPRNGPRSRPGPNRDAASSRKSPPNNVTRHSSAGLSRLSARQRLPIGARAQKGAIRPAKGRLRNAVAPRGPRPQLKLHARPCQPTGTRVQQGATRPARVRLRNDQARRGLRARPKPIRAHRPATWLPSLRAFSRGSLLPMARHRARSWSISP